jgi:multimeric flavodoxin WrbA
MLAADGIIIGSPTYYANCTATTQALMERAGYATRKCGNPLRRKVGAAVVAVRRGGAIHAFDSINHWFQINEMIVIGSSYWNLGIGAGIGEVEGDEEGMETMTTLGRTMAWALRKLNA